MLVPLPALILTLLAPHATAASSQGAIVQPTAGTAIAPGAKFNFTYDVMADYSVSSFWYHVWLLDPLPTAGSDSKATTTTTVSSALAGIFHSGYYFGRFDYPNYPAVPYASNPCPSQLTMPDFSKTQGDAAGETAANLPLQLVVIEEWGNSEASVGHRLHVSSVQVVYNATHPQKCTFKLEGDDETKICDP